MRKDELRQIIPTREELDESVRSDIARVFDSQYADGEQGRLIRYMMVEHLDKLWDAIRELNHARPL